MPLTIHNPRKIHLPKADYEAIKNAALGADYELGLIVSTPEEVKKLNLIYRNIDKATDILSFPLSEKSGEIYICPEETQKKAKDFDREYDNFFVFLFIHGCAHLKGYDHDDRMEEFEVRIRRQFDI